jgi:outer membrane protein OmpA-like peptidoglycan-associated protein
VTAEPYFTVTQPSDVDDTTGTFEQVEAKYELFQRGSYIRKDPLQLAEAENALQIAQLAGADTYARDTLEKAMSSLQNAEDFGIKNHDRKWEETTAREATQMAEDARIIAIKKVQEEQLAQERSAEAETEAEATANAETQRRAQAEADSERAKREAETAQSAPLAQQQAAQLEAGKANRARRQEIELRSQLLQKLETVRGLDTAKDSLRAGAREKLAKISGIVISHPDSVGGDEYNQRLSEQRAASVRDYLVEQGIPATSATVEGFGKTMPVASNDTEAGRQQNRRVELVVSGDVIGAEVSSLR